MKSTVCPAGSKAGVGGGEVQQPWEAGPSQSLPAISSWVSVPWNNFQQRQVIGADLCRKRGNEMSPLWWDGGELIAGDWKIRGF